MSEKKIVGILPNNYVHVLDLVSAVCVCIQRVCVCVFVALIST